MRHLLLAAATAALAAIGAAVPAHAAQPCDNHDLALLTDAKGGDLGGMSHSGTMLGLHNTGKSICTLPAQPPIELTTANGQILPIRLARATGGTGPAPAGTIDLPPGGDVTGSLRWVSGDVYDHGTCVDAAALRLTLPGGGLEVPLKAHLCGPSDQEIGIEQGALKPGL